jgi:hypothetical protein
VPSKGVDIRARRLEIVKADFKTVQQMEATAASAQHHDERLTSVVDAMEGVETLPHAAHTDEAEKKGVTSKDLTASSVSSHSVPTSETPAPAIVPVHEPTAELAQPVSTTVSQQHQAQPPANVQETTPIEQSSHSQPPRVHLHPVPPPNTSPATPASLASTPPPAQATQIRRPHQEANGVMIRFASPDNDHQAQVPRFKRDLSLVADAVQQSCPEAVRRIIRDKWEKCITGSEFHHAFIVSLLWCLLNTVSSVSAVSLPLCFSIDTCIHICTGNISDIENSLDS